MTAPVVAPDTPASRLLSPRRKTTEANSIEELALEQMAHFGIDPDSSMGAPLRRICERLYHLHDDMSELWAISMRELARLDRKDRVAYFNAKKFLCFQIAKILDMHQNPFRRSFQELRFSSGTTLAKGGYPIFDNVTAIFSATPVITRTATYIFACTEWIDDAFQGKELLHEIYSRLLNPTSVSLANQIVEVEAGPLSVEYFAWNFNSGMAAIDCILSHVLGKDDIVISSRNVYGGTYQLLHDWFGKPSNLNVALEWFDGFRGDEFAARLAEVQFKYADRIAEGRRIYVFLESPCNPHGYYLDVPAICRIAHEQGITVMLDSTVGTPFLQRPLQRTNPLERPDYLIHSYTKDLAGTGTTTAGVVIGRNEQMFLPKGENANGVQWNETLFWNVYYVKGAFLDSDKAFEVMTGMKTLEQRMLKKCINTRILCEWMNRHPDINVCSPAVKSHRNHPVMAEQSYLGLPAPLFTIDFEHAGMERLTFERFFDCLSPAFGHMVSLGQCNTVVLCPALTSHSELSPAALKDAGISPTTIRIAVGDENPGDLIAHFISAARLAIEPEHPGFCDQFLSLEETDELMERLYVEAHAAHCKAQPRMAEILR